MSGPEGGDEGRSFESFAVENASTVSGLVLLILGDAEGARDLVDQTWPDVFRRWPGISRSPHLMASAHAPFVRQAIRIAEQSEADLPESGRGGLELRDDLMLGAAALPGQRELGSGTTGEATTEDPGDAAVSQAFSDLPPRERALVALSVYVGLDDSELAWAVRWRPPRAAYVMHRAHRDLMLTAAPQVIGHVRDAAESGAMQQRVRRVLERCAASAEVDPEAQLARVRPLVSGVAQRRALPRPRGLRVVGAALVTSAVVIAATVALTHRAAEEPTTTAEVTPVPHAAPGMRLVGFHGVYTSVPSSWSHNQLECGKAVANTVVYPDATVSCAHGPLVYGVVPPSSVTFSEPPTNPLVLGRLRQINDVGGQGVYATIPVTHEDLIQRLVIIPEASVQMVVRGPDPHVLDDIVDSLQPLPDGYAVVPPCERLPLRQAIGLLDEVGLQVRLTQASTLSERETPPPVTHQTIASGEVVPVGTTIGLGFPSMN